MTSIHCLIIDDEPMARELLETYCKRTGYIAIVASCKSAVEAFQILHEQDIDVMFLDIQMPGIDGLSFLRSLRKPPKVIFTTAYSTHAVDAFELEAIDYLLKPITYERFLQSVQRITGKQEQGAIGLGTHKSGEIMGGALNVQPNTEPTSIFLKVNRRLVQIELNEVLYFESLGDYVKVITTSQMLVCYTTLNKLTHLLPEELFHRIHRSYMISLKRISFMEGNFVKIEDHDIPIGQTYKEGLMKRLNIKGDMD